MPFDAFSRIRSLLDSRNTPSYPQEDAAKVIARTHASYLTERQDKSRLDYGRRSRHTGTGFESLPHLPYRPFAGLKHTDAHCLIADTMGLPFQHADTPRPPLTDSEHSKECTKTPSHTNQHTIRVVRDCGGGKRAKEQSKTAGLSVIQLHVNSTARAMREVATGAAYQHTQPREEERRRYIQWMRTPKKLGGDEGSCFVHNPSTYLPLLVNTASSRTCLISHRPHNKSRHTQPGDKLLVMEEQEEEEEEEVEEDRNGTCQRVGPNIYVAVAAAHFKMNFGHPAWKKEISPAKRLQMRNCLAKIKAVYSILCCLYNMKLKDLKEKRPLPLATIKQMSVKPLPNRETVHHHGHRLGTHMYHTRTPSYHLHPHKHAGHAVESWEDLLLIGRFSGNHGNADTPSTPLSAHQDNHHKITRSLPPWQRQLVLVDNNESSSSDPAVALAECLRGFQGSKDHVSEQTKLFLNKRQKSSTHLLGVKVRELKLGANIGSCLREMRETAYDIVRSERTNEKNRPAWYGQLEKEAASAFESRAVDSREQNMVTAAAKWLLERMKYFLYFEIDTVPRVMEKLCLLVMSLPADQLCLTPVISSVQFVLEAILEMPARLSQQWLEMRGVTVTGVPLPQQPVIVFGLTV